MSAAAFERQLRPIYDALDTGSNKTAILACNKVLKKHPTSGQIKALKALALVRSQKVEEALALCDEVLATKPMDDGTLSAMTHVLKGLGRNSDTIKMFEEAYKTQPGNEELAAQTFFANARTGNWKACQQIAMKMHKNFQEDRYLYWNAICAVLQAKDSATPETMRGLLYELARRVLAPNTALSCLLADRFYLHLTVLRELKAWDEAQSMLDTELGKNICNTSLHCDALRREIAQERGSWIEEGELAKQRIADQHDRNWLEFLSILDATFSYLRSAADADAREKCARHVAETREFLAHIAAEDGLKDRSASLALVDLANRTSSHGLSTDPEDVVAAMEKYFDVYGDKACCFEDLRPYLGLEGDRLSRWSSFLQSKQLSSETTKDLVRTINIFKFIRHNLTEAELSTEQEIARAAQYIQYYSIGLRLGKDLPDTELQPADDLAVLAGDAYIGLWATTQDDVHLQNAASFLEFASSKSKQSYLIRLLLIRIYRLLGAPQLALEHYRALNIKQMQNDTLSHLVLTRASIFSLTSIGDLTLSSECLEANQIYVSNSQETSEFIVRAFTAEKYSMVPDFIEFEERLENSLQRDLMKIEHVRMRVTHEPITNDLVDMELIELKLNFDRLFTTPFSHDNRDFTVFPEYHPRCRKSVEERTILFGRRPGPGWLRVMLKLYVAAFSDASDLDETVEEKLLVGDRPKPGNHPEGKLSFAERLHKKNQEETDELTPDELAFMQYCNALGDWLRPWHDHTRPPPAQVLAEAAKQSEARTGKPLQGVEIPPVPKNGTSNGHSKDHEPPSIEEPPEILLKYFNDMQQKFTELVERKALPYEILNVFTLTQEALIFFTVETNRFKSPSVVRMHKLGNLVASFKDLRPKFLAVFKDMSARLLKLSEVEGTSDDRRKFVDACKPVIDAGIDHDFVLGVAKKVTDSRKKLLEGVAKGAQKVATMHSS
ncbi:actin cytoskeleton organization protein [Punctularia strigosozonata HHB-11173 SS5]|uniref:actin cytoskeleton organization protein n=1 Tax=Punctularia strigosozonata (strain HHB-11173) TaxID=741275 RepID=UPI00044184F5|nr:actin cytoskeleton organization protein [Punctularia strigosozonata HHB-11173 SS5]EIN07294.1 actin cytoskeleton organization protein [Punctularia strigosozonata HHB-11173 SS5]